MTESDLYQSLDRELDALINQVIEQVAPAEVGAIPTLYQYTDGRALRSILEHERIWATHSAFLNDYGEGKYIWDRMLRVADGNNDLEPMTAKVTKDLLSHLATHPAVLGKEVFVACFSEDPDSLSQWRAYANDGDGYSVGFRLAKVPEATEICPELSTDLMGPLLAPVLYDEGRQSEALSVIPRMIEASKQAVEQGLEQTQAELVCVASVLRLASLLACYFKHPGFQEEREWRLVWIPTAEFAQKCAKRLRDTQLLGFRDTKYGMAPYLDWPLRGADGEAPTSIAEIWMGPRAAPTTEHSLEMFLLSLGRPPGSVKICSSETTYR
ncbi:MAG: DUF2971 domain-containing protein [Myxococcota bacterium]|nr:DUF2971 domain-containing protein [Myxococcota bacterium]